MRELLFKAKRIDNGEWVEGYYVCLNKTLHLIYTGYAETDCGEYYPDWFEIDINTLCQYTGLKDKNGNKIWENDVIGFLDVSQYDNGYAEYSCIGKVVWDEETVSFEVTERLSCESYEALNDCSVLGNIFDNPELLKEGAE